MLQLVVRYSVVKNSIVYEGRHQKKFPFNREIYEWVDTLHKIALMVKLLLQRVSANSC